MANRSSIDSHFLANLQGLEASTKVRDEMLNQSSFGPLEEIQQNARNEIQSRIVCINEPSKEKLFDVLQSLHADLSATSLDVIVRFNAQIDTYIRSECGGSHLLFASLWNSLLDDPAFQSLCISCFRSMFDPLPIGNHAFDESPTKLYFSRHGKSKYDSRKMKVGRRTPNKNTQEGTDLARRMANIFALKIAQNIEHDSKNQLIKILTSSSPNTNEELGLLFAEALDAVGVKYSDPVANDINESQDFGYWTGLSKEDEKNILKNSGIDPAIVKHPFFMYPGGDIFGVFLAQYSVRFRQLADGEVAQHLLCTHSSSLQALRTAYEMQIQSFMPYVADMRTHKEGQECIIGIGANELGIVTPYAPFIGETVELPAFSFEKNEPLHMKISLRTTHGCLVTMDLQAPIGLFGKTLTNFERNDYKIQELRSVL